MENQNMHLAGIILLGMGAISCKMIAVSETPTQASHSDSSAQNSAEQNTVNSQMTPSLENLDLTTLQPLSQKAYPQGVLAWVPTHYNMSVAIAPDGSIYWTEFGKMRLMRYSSKGLEVVLANTPGLYGVTVDSKGRVYIGQDMSDEPFKTGPDAGQYQGSVNRVDFDSAKKAYLTKVLKFIRRPRQLIMDGSTVYLTLEAERRIISCTNVDTRANACIPKPANEAPAANEDTKYWKTVLTTNVIPPTNGLAFRDGVFYWAETGIYQVNADGSKWIEKGRVRSSSGKPGETIKTVVDGIGRARGLGFDATGNLYVTCESEDKDEGNSGTLGVITLDGKYTVLVRGLDYPQFPAVYPNGSVLLTTARENFMLLYQPNLNAPKLKSPYPGVDLYGTNFINGPNPPKNATLILEFTDLKKKYSFPVFGTNKGPMSGWLIVDIKSLNLPKKLFDLYTIEPSERSAMVPGPGWFRTPPVKCTLGGKPCAAKVMVHRTQGGRRWPMSYPNGVEMPFPGFTENPDQFMVNFFF